MWTPLSRDGGGYSGSTGETIQGLEEKLAGVVHACTRIKVSPVCPKADLDVAIEVRHAFSHGEPSGDGFAAHEVC
jgi:hypothetical protein